VDNISISIRTLANIPVFFFIIFSSKDKGVPRLLMMKKIALGFQYSKDNLEIQTQAKVLVLFMVAGTKSFVQTNSLKKPEDNFKEPISRAHRISPKFFFLHLIILKFPN